MPPEAALIASLPLTSEIGRWQRHVSSVRVNEALDGRPRYGRWGTPSGFPVLYLGRPRASVVVEAYRHLVDPIEDEADREALKATIQPRVLVTCSVHVTRLLDLRTAGARASVGLIPEELTSPTDDVEAYRQCQHLAQITHQLGRHGIITPAATGMGETLALFTDLLPAAERPVRLDGADEHWSALPDDPRIAGANPVRLRVVGTNADRRPAPPA